MGYLMARTPNAASARSRRLGKAERRIIELQKTGPEGWLYLGDYDADPFTTFYSPPYLNSYSFSGGAEGRIRVRWDEHSRHEWAGVWDVNSASSGDLACQLPALWLPDATYDFPIILDLGGGSFSMLRQVVEENGDVTLYWPIS